MSEREGAPDMCYVCGYGESGICSCPAVLALLRSQGKYNRQDVVDEMDKRSTAGECPDAMKDNNCEVTSVGINRMGLKRESNTWKWQKKIAPTHVDLGWSKKRAHFKEGRFRKIHIVQRVK